MKYEKLQEIQNRSRNVREFSKESVNKKINMKPRNFREITKSRIHADMRNALILKLNADDADVIMKKALSFADKKVDEMRKEWQEVRQIRKDRRKKNAVLYKEKLTSYQNEIRRKRAERMKKLQSDHALALQVRKDSAGKAEAEDSDDFEDEMVARDVELEAEKAPSEVDKIEVVMRNVCDVFDDSEEDEQVVENRNEATHAYYASTFVSKYLSGIRDPGNTELPEQFEEKVVDKSASSLSDLSDAIKKPTFDFSKLDISSKLALVKACKTRRNNEPPFVPAPKILNSVRIIPGDDGGKPKILVPKATDVIMADSYELEQLLADELGSRLGPAAIVGDTIRSRLLGRPMPKEYVTPEQTNVEGSKAENEKAEKSAVSDVASSSKTPLHVLANIAVTSAKPLATNSPVNMVSKQVDKIAGFGRFSEIEKQVTEKAQYSSIGQTITAAQAEIRKLAGFGEMKEKFDSYVEPDVKVITPDTVFPIHLGGVAGEPININIPVHIYAPQPATTTAAPQAPAATAQEKKKDTPTSAQSTQTAGEVATAAKQALDKKNLEQTTAPQTDEPNVAANKKIPTPEEKNDVTMDKRENEKEQHLHDAATLLLATAAALKRNEQQNSQAKNLAALRIKNDEREVIASSSCGVERAAIGSDKKKGVTKLLSNGIEEINRRAASAAIAAANYGSRYRKAMRKKKKKASEVSPLSKATDESVSSESGSEEANVPKPSRLEKYTYLRYEWASKITKLLMLQTKIKRNIERVASNPEKRETFESQLADNKSKLYKANGIFITVLEKVLSLQASLCDPTDPKIQATKEELLMIMDEAKKMIVENAPPPGTKIARKKSKKKRDKKAKAGKSRSNEKEGASKSAAVVEKVASKAKVGSERKSAVKEKTAEKRSSSVPPSPKAKLPTEKSVGNGGRKTRAGSKDIFGDSATKKAGSPAATATYNCKCKSQVSRGKPSVNCDQCGKWSHLACVNMTPGQAEAIPQWFCGECLEKDNRSCYCMEKDEHHQDQFVQCDKCDIWYHTRCLLLSPKHIDSGEFICFRCKDDSGTYFEVLTNFMLRKITEHNYESLEDVIEELKTIQQVQPMWWNCELLNEKVMESNKRKKNYNAIKFDLSKLMEKIRQRKYVTIHEMLVELGAAIDLFTSDITKKATFAKNSADLMEMHLMEGLRTLLDEGHIAATAKQAAEKIASKARRKSSSRSSSAMRLEAASPLAVSKVVEEIASVRSAKRKSPGSDVEASKKESDVAGDKTEDESKKIILENASDSTHVVGNTNEDSKVNEGDKKDSESVATDQSTPRSMKRARKPVRTYSP